MHPVTTQSGTIHGRHRCTLGVAVLLLIAACGQSDNGSADTTTASGSTGASATTSTGSGTSQTTTTQNGATSSTNGAVGGASSSAGSSTGGASTSAGSAATGGSAGAVATGLSSDPECVFVNGLVRSYCDEGVCLEFGKNDSGPVYQCASPCPTDGSECQGDTECYYATNTAALLCGPTRPSCDVTAVGDECPCKGFRYGPILHVSGTGEGCTVIDDDATACFWANGGCLDACIYAFYRYELDDGTALIMHTTANDISAGWMGDGAGPAPLSCPAAGSYY